MPRRTATDRKATTASSKRKQGKPILSQPQIRRVYSPVAEREFIIFPFDVPLMAPLHDDDQDVEPGLQA